MGKQGTGSLLSGLIALRKQLYGICDKSKDSYKRITDMWKEKDVIGFTVLNDKKARWSQVKIIYNARKSSYKVKFLNDGWEILTMRMTAGAGKKESVRTDR